jgi:hypothetical protein
MTNKSELTKLQKNYLKAKAKHEYITKLDKRVKNMVLAENEFFVSSEWKDRAGQRITQENIDYLMVDSDFEKYCKLVFEAGFKVGIERPDDNTTADYKTLPILEEAEKALLDFGSKITLGKVPELTAEVLKKMNGNLKIRAELLKLLCRLRLD